MENKVSAILEGLNDDQRDAVLCTDGPVLIVAGAGSGKTRVLTCRIAYLLEKGADPSRIMALTFTRKAAAEMKERVGAMVGSSRARQLRMGTFHSVFVRFLREFSSAIGYPESFTILDQSDSTSAIKACIKELGLDDKTYKPREVLSRISMAKNAMITDVRYRESPALLEDDRRSRRPRICEIYTLYRRKCLQSGVMDFDDILLNMNFLLAKNEEARKSIRSRFTHILVDEYQDTNHSQYEILRSLAYEHHNLCVVGDDSQSIYAFRGAEIQNILNFKKDYPECRTFRLERNYRSTQVIVGAANSLISHNEGRIPKECYSKGEKGEKIRLIPCGSEMEEASIIASSIIDRMQSDKSRYSDFAILYRTNAQSRALEEALRRRNLPYFIYSGNAFFDRAEVRDLMAYFKLVENPGDDESFKRIVNKPARGIGGTTMTALEQFAASKRMTLFAAASLPDLEQQSGIRGAAVLKISAFISMIKSLRELAPSTDAYELALKTANISGLYDFYKADTSIEGLSRFANVDELLGSVKEFVEERTNDIIADMGDEAPDEILVTIGDYLENVSLLSNIDNADDEDASNKIALMTAHSAKGLEFPHVFVSGLEENLFPSGSMLSSKRDIEEERRLFYVAMTRAERDLSLSWASTRMRNGNRDSNPPSRFLGEISSEFISNPWSLPAGPRSSMSGPVTFIRRASTASSFDPFAGPAPRRDRPIVSEPPSRPAFQGKASVLQRPLPPKVPDSEFTPLPMSAFKVGQRIEHNRFGGGLIEEITGTIPELKARIVFDEYGEKLILLKYAKMRFETK